jgi:signal transduction histidine kinase
MAEVATGVLHNVGNVLNTVNVSADIVAQRIQQSRLHGLNRLVQLLDQHNEDIPRFLAEDPAGKMVPVYLRQLDQYFREEQEAQQQDLHLLRRSVDHIKEIVAMQQSYARSSALYEKLTPIEAVEEALRIQEGSLTRHSVKVVKEYETIAPFLIDKHKVLQILINLLTNAKNACDERDDVGEKQVIIRVRRSAEGHVRIEVEDNGGGIAPENLDKIFTQGFTTRINGHGFGLHSSALAAREMGGCMSVHSAGKDRGATFILELPIRDRIDTSIQAVNGSSNGTDLTATVKN